MAIINVGTTINVVTTTKMVIELDSNKIRDLLLDNGISIPESASVRIYFAVPGGADWSSTDLDITQEHPVYVEWETVTERKSHGS